MEHQVRKAIIQKLIHNPRISYNQMWEKEGDSSKFAYHLKQLEEEGIVAKFDDGYGLTSEGRKLSAFIEGDTGGKAELPTPIVVILAWKDNQLLYQQRLKEPFYGYWGPVSGKVNFGWNPRDCAIRDLKEETNLDAVDMQFRAIQSIKTYEGEKLLHHHLLYVFETSKFNGELKVQTHKGLNKFMSLAEARQQKRFPLDFIFTDVPPGRNFFIIESERFMKNGQFVDSRILRMQQYEPLDGIVVPMPS